MCLEQHPLHDNLLMNFAIGCDVFFFCAVLPVYPGYQCFAMNNLSDNMLLLGG